VSRFCAVLLICFSLFANEMRLYLKDGTFHVVREYKVLPDRVSYYSTERGEWEELPIDLVDLKRTESEIKAQQEVDRKQAAEEAAEDKFERAMNAEINAVPTNAGLYTVNNLKVRVFPHSETRLVTDKKRSVLKIITPIPIIAGRSTLEMDGEQSKEVVDDLRPNFYFRPSRPERFTIVRMKPKKNARIIQVWNIVPQVNEISIDQDVVEVFRHEVRSGLYKVWPMKPLEPGEYAMVEWTEGGEGTEAWDFRVVAPPPN
jgi:hypothetical protein